MAWRSTCPHPQQVSVGRSAWLSTETAPAQLAPHPSQRGIRVPAFQRGPYISCVGFWATELQVADPSAGVYRSSPQLTSPYPSHTATGSSVDLALCSGLGWRPALQQQRNAP